MRRVALVLLTLAILAVPAAASAQPINDPPPTGGPNFEDIFEPRFEWFENGLPGHLLERTAGYVAGSGGDAGDSFVATPGTPTFFPNVKMPCSAAKAGLIGCGQLVEPEVAQAPDGTIYVTAQEGVGGGVNIWKRDPSTHKYVQLRKPDGIPTVTTATGVAPGGGDNDIAISSDGKLYVTSLNLGTATLSTSTDRGKSWSINPIANMMPGVDRQWIAARGPKQVYMAYHDIAVANIWLVKSTNSGLTFGAPTSMIPPEQILQFGSAGLALRDPDGKGIVGSGNKTSDIIVDPDGRVGIAFVADNPDNSTFARHAVFASITAPGGKTPVVHKVFEDTDDANLVGLFPSIASDQAGNLYVAWTRNQQGVYLSKSTDHGVTWSDPALISNNPYTVFPYLVAGSAGRVAATWLGATDNGDTAEWHTYFAQNLDTLNTPGGFTQVEASDHVIHKGAICLGGLGCNASDPTGAGGRELAEVVEAGILHDGRVLISYPDNSGTASGWTYVAEQKLGDGLYADQTPYPPADPPPAADVGGPVTDPTVSLGTETLSFAGAPSLLGKKVGGHEVDLPGAVGSLTPDGAKGGHVASGNVTTTAVLGIPLVFEGATLTEDRIIGGTLNVRTFLQDPVAEAATGTIEVALLDVDSEGNGRTITVLVQADGVGYAAGAATTEGNYPIAIPKIWELKAGHHLRVEIDFTCICSSSLLFYYGRPSELAGITYGRYARS